MSASATIRVAGNDTAPGLSDIAIAPPDAPIARRRHINWALKAILPIAVVLLNGLLLFILVTLSLEADQRHIIISVATAGAIVIFTAIIMVLAVSVRRPMLELQDKIARVSLGDLDASVNFASRNDEIGDLGRDFNEMVAQLRASREEIQRLHQTQMSRAEHFATLGELAAGLAHEIRNPLAGIAGVIEIVGRDLPPESRAREVIKDAREEAVQINRILTDLLETARPKPPHFQLKDLNGTVEHAVLFARQQAVTKGIRIEWERAEDAPPVDHDPNQMNQVLLNLLLNAIQAMEKPGTIYVSLQRDREAALITVADQGKGIAPDVLPNIFRPFFTTKGHGTGLGLSLARRIVEAHGGTITARSELGKGAQFLVRLPMGRKQLATSN
ncbi:MAG TPA: ATP-binding protein [Terriglobales bacterium]|nr:ATP-binding protein [Terriglobales bacterium]